VSSVLLEGVTKVFSGPGGRVIRALSEVNVGIEDQECLAVVGPSGSGKTTALRLIAGLEAPTSGTISIAGRTVNGVAPKQRDVAMVFQSPALYPHMSVYENLGFGLKLRRCSSPEIDRRVREVAEMLGLTACLASAPMGLSGGQRQRVAIGRAIVRRASVLLLDEPLANVDPTLRAQMRSEISDLRRRFGTTMIYVTHDHLEAMMMGDRIAVLRDGQVQQVAEPQRLYNRPDNMFVAEFVGFPPMNLFKGLLVWEGLELFFEAAGPAEANSVSSPNAIPAASEAPTATQFKQREGLRLRLESTLNPFLEGYVSKSVILGVRPEHIACGSAEFDSQSGAILRAKVLSIQTVGPDSYLTGRYGGNSFVARVPSTTRVVRDQECAFVFDLQRASFFDPVTGNAIELPCEC
jgi:multiple sugar transport system ATP-binding protein